MSGNLSSAGRGSLPAQAGVRLAMRRRARRRRALIALGILFLILCGGIVYELNQNAVRIARVQVFGPPSLRSFGEASADQSLANIALKAIQGKYLGIIPRDSIFFFPASSIRSDILLAHPDIAAISIFRNGLTGLSIKIDTRVPIARWCGSTGSPQVASSTGNCYVFDAGGFIFATTSSSQPLNSFILYEPLDASSSPIGLTLPNADKLHSVFDFARQLDTLGSPVTRVVVRDGEVDEYLSSGTRITYVFGHEQDAFTALVSARGTFNIADGSVDYVDLRFDGKVYLKKK